jgi:hypothetical protein
VRQKTFKKIEKNETKNPKKIAKLEKKTSETMVKTQLIIRCRE